MKVVNGVRVNEGIGKCLDCEHEWPTTLLGKVESCPKCQAWPKRITFFTVLEDGSKGEKHPPPRRRPTG